MYFDFEKDLIHLPINLTQKKLKSLPLSDAFGILLRLGVFSPDGPAPPAIGAKIYGRREDASQK